MTELSKQIAKNIRKVCKKAHVSINEVECMSGIGQNSIYKWGTVCDPSLENLVRVAETLQTTVSELTRG